MHVSLMRTCIIDLHYLQRHYILSEQGYMVVVFLVLVVVSYLAVQTIGKGGNLHVTKFCGQRIPLSYFYSYMFERIFEHADKESLCVRDLRKSGIGKMAKSPQARSCDSEAPDSMCFTLTMSLT